MWARMWEQQWAAEEEEEEAAYRRHEARTRLGQRCPDADGEPCWYCEDEEEDDDDDDDDASWEREGCREEPADAGPATFCGFRKAFLCKAPAPASSAPDCPLLGFALPQQQQRRRLTAEEAERNAEELVAEEERLKKKAEKKRLKKRRQKDRKKQERREQQLQAESGAPANNASWSQSTEGRDPLAGIPSSCRPDSEGSSTQEDPSESLAPPGRSTEEEEEIEEELDLTSTFVSKARLKVGPKPFLPPSLRKGKTARPARGKELEVKAPQEVPRSPGFQMGPVEQSLVLADCGNETAKRECYREAVLLFTEAVKLNPREYRFFGNRSFCYEKLQCYVEALRDAQLALSLQPGWPKGLFRQGKALMGLQRYAEAANTFEELLRLDGFRHDAAIQLERCHAQLLLENGFGQQCNPTVKWNILAGESQLPLPGDQARGPPSKSISSQAGGRLTSVSSTSSKGKGLPPPGAQAPVREWFAVWVGNLMPQVTQEVLVRHFQPFGAIDSIRRLPRKFCAFVNYTSKDAAEAAFRALQGVEVEGSRLLLQLKHPAHATATPLLPTKAPSAPPVLDGARQKVDGAQGKPCRSGRPSRESAMD